MWLIICTVGLGAAAAAQKPEDPYEAEQAAIEVADKAATEVGAVAKVSAPYCDD